MAHSAALLGLPMGRVNVNGGAVALGHPIGAAGARVVVTAVCELIRRETGRAAVALCGGGGAGCPAPRTLMLGQDYGWQRTVQTTEPTSTRKLASSSGSGTDTRLPPEAISG